MGPLREMEKIDNLDAFRKSIPLKYKSTVPDFFEYTYYSSLFQEQKFADDSLRAFAGCVSDSNCGEEVEKEARAHAKSIVWNA